MTTSNTLSFATQGPFPFGRSRIPFVERQGLQLFPDGKRLAMLVYTAPEEWQWDTLEPFLPPGSVRFEGESVPSISVRSAIDYGFYVGLHRFRELFNEYGLKTTLWTNGNTVEQHRDIIELLVSEGHELGGHSYSEGMPMASLTTADKQESIRRSFALIEEVTGKPPAGWLGPGAIADEETIKLLVQAGIRYTGDLNDDELPYFLHVDGRTVVSIPYRSIGNLNDLSLATALRGTPKSVPQYREHFLSAFQAYHDEAQRRPLIVNFGTHPHVSGRPDNIVAFRALIEEACSHDDVWLCTYSELADWWTEQFSRFIPEDKGDLAGADLPRAATVA
jgi:peptidoglycan/xylan/chitin deacetylase (PgdA/CDA1 family)